MERMNKKKIAILFFGLTRSLHKTIQSLHTNLFNVLRDNSYSYDTFIHTYKIQGEYNNQWSRESTKNYINEDVEALLKPTYFIHDNQQDIVKKFNFEDYYKNLGDWRGKPPELVRYLIRNMCLALYSKKQITKLFEQHKDEYDYAIIIRPDMMLKTKLDITWFNELRDDTILIPERDSYGGCNDRFCIGTVNTILYYGTLLDSLKEYSEKKSITSEGYLLDMLNEKSLKLIKKNIQYDCIRYSESTKQLIPQQQNASARLRASRSRPSS
jgi:hypothetical protein